MVAAAIAAGCAVGTTCVSGKLPDAIGGKKSVQLGVGWNARCPRAIFWRDRAKALRQKPENGSAVSGGYYLAARGLTLWRSCRNGWGLLEVFGREFEKVKPRAKNFAHANRLWLRRELAACSCGE